MLTGKRIVVGVTGGIGCYKICDVVSRLKKLNAEVDVIMTRHAAEFVSPLTFETLSKNRVVTDMFERNFHREVEHISLAQKADLFLIAPATANILGKLACGIADDMLSTTVLATRARVLLVPSMNTRMYENAAVQENLQVLSGRGYSIMQPASGLLACGDVGTGKLPEPSDIVERAVSMLTAARDFEGKRVLVTAGATRERLDAVRYVTNDSSGKMGVALADAFLERGAKVTLVAGNVLVPLPPLAKVVRVETTAQMYDAVLREMERADIIVKAAAPADYRPREVSGQKIKSDVLTLELVKNPDIAKAVGERKGERLLVIFCAETEQLVQHAKEKLSSKHADLVVANDVTQEGAGFYGDTNIVTLIDRSGCVQPLEKMQKSTLSHIILDKIAELVRGTGKT